MSANSSSARHLEALWPKHSAYAQRWLSRFPEWNTPLTPDKPLDDVVKQELAALHMNLDEVELKKQLRLHRQRLMLEMMRRDLLGLCDLKELTNALSLMADICLDIACRWAHQHFALRHGSPENQDQLLIVGMGKLGGEELNASSDVDLIFVYNQEGETSGGAANGLQKTGKQLSHAEFFNLVGKKILCLISEVTAEGFVFRVDMRLRPNGDSGPLVVSIDMLEEYFIVQGREWERYAWIKARVVNQPADHERQASFASQIKALEQLRRAFVFRRYLDFGAIGAIRDLHHQIRQEVKKRERNDDPGSVHVKLGRGGIREIEFIAQVFQLIRGGRDPELQTRPTVEVLTLCAQKGLIKLDVAQQLCQAYTFWRQLEHRLQYVEDAQTHHLPSDPTVRQTMALAMNLDSIELLNEHIAHWQTWVEAQFLIVFSNKNPAKQEDVGAHQWPEAWCSRFIELEQAQARWSDLVNSARFRSLPEAHRRRMNRLLPALAEACVQTNHPDRAWARSIALLESISRRGAYLSLLDEFPKARERLVRLLSASQWATDYLCQHPILLDEMLDERSLYQVPNWLQYEQELRKSLKQAYLSNGQADLEMQMNLSREQHQTQVFHLLAQDLEGYWTVERLSDQLCELADKTLAAILDETWQQLPKRHRENHQFAIIAYGKYGGKELGYASDLDLIFLYDDYDPQAPELYSKLAQRFNRWLTTQTSAGYLFETDYRLRPNGAAGLLVSSLQAFESYQKRKNGVGAWVWEHQALTRARFCAGYAPLGQAFENIRTQVLRTDRNLCNLAEDVIKMRQKIHDAHPNTTALFDLKHSPGGMVDIEFIVQFLVLAHSATFTELTANKGNIALLKACARLGLVNRELAAKVGNCYRELRAQQHALRLEGAPMLRVDPSLFKQAIIAVKALWEETIVAASRGPGYYSCG
jgi:[glutamine synthetase] adenylyltransferase / [glutamine synthetase]-adenylyl-L-tyrosine phosphorylase